MKIQITIALLFAALGSMAQTGQKPKQHVYYDTVKTVQQRVDYSPDTIPVYFKEIIITHHGSGLRQDGMKYNTDLDSVYDKWTIGYVIWQTYKKRTAGLSSIGGITGMGTFSNGDDYYIDEFEPTKFTENAFLYADRKTKVKNRVLYTIKR